MGKGPSAAGEPLLLPGAGRFSFVPWQVTRTYRSMLLTSIETQKGGPARNPLSHLILGIEKRTSAETLMSVSPSAHKSRYIQLSGFTQGRLRRSLAHITIIPMSYCIDLLAMRIDIRNRLWLSNSHCASRVLHHIMHDKLGKLLIYMNCNYTPSWHLYSDSRQLHYIVCVATAETEDTCNHMDRSGIGKQQHHRCD